MLRLLLLRHAKSDWSRSGLSDHDRPLAPRGLRDAPRIGRFLRDRGLVPAAVLASTARRAGDTARLVLAAAGAQPGIVRLDRNLYGASAEGILRVVGGKRGGASPLLVVAHNPGIEDLAARFSEGFEPFPTGALLVVEAHLTRWADLTPDAASAGAVVRPRGLGKEPDHSTHDTV